MKSRHHCRLLLIISLAAFGALIVLGAGYWYTHRSLLYIGPPAVLTTEEPGLTSDANFYDTIAYVPLLTSEQSAVVHTRLGTTSPAVLSDTYRLFVVPDNVLDSNVFAASNPTHYFDDGIITSGSYVGYHRIIAELQPADVPDGPSYFTFATKEYKTFVAYAPRTGLVPNPNVFNASIVTSADTFPISFPDSLPVGKFLLRRGNIFAYSGRDTISTMVPSDVVELSSPTPDLRIFSEPVQDNEFNFHYATTTDPEYVSYKDTVARYLESRTTVIARDAAGINFVYALSFPIPDEGAYHGFLSVVPTNTSLFKSYGRLMPHGCAGADTNGSYVLKNVSDGDVKDTGISWRGTELYTLADKDHPIVSAEYFMKSYQMRSWPEYYDNSATLANVSLSEYEGKEPVLLFKDPWDRWVAIGEQDYQTPTGCGKPVIYLYPTKPTEVSVEFGRGVPTFTKDIPTYASGWKVLAHPDGTLTDLQPAATDCEKIDTKAFGSEYAKAACAAGKYPYLYWAGNVDGEYPTPTGGWVVEKDNLHDFLQSKLQFMGLNQTEQQDMLSYWVPKMLQKNTPYYRISFFQNAQMNAFIPMQVYPRPNSTLRVFLDWAPLRTLPDTKLQPQQLSPFVRRGFTMVEWGGLDR
jgi:hypothetical protein